MRRMITETDVEKLDSIQPSEIEKLGKITNADIESVKATQSPIGATANYVLTADGAGKAVYKAPASGGIKRIDAVSRSRSYSKDNFGIYSEYQGYRVVKESSYHQISVLVKEFPYYTTAEGQKIYLSPNDYFMTFEATKFVFGIKKEVYDKYVSDIGSKNSLLYTGIYGFLEYQY